MVIDIAKEAAHYVERELNLPGAGNTIGLVMKRVADTFKDRSLDATVSQVRRLARNRKAAAKVVSKFRRSRAGPDDRRPRDPGSRRSEGRTSRWGQGRIRDHHDPRLRHGGPVQWHE